MGANAVTTVYDFTAGQVLTAAQMDNVNCGVPVFANGTARDAAFGGTGEKTLAQGQMAFVETTGLQFYDGSNWISAGYTTSYTPVWTTTGTAPALGNGSLTGRFYRFEKLVHFVMKFAAGSTTTFGTGSFQFSTPTSISAVNNFGFPAVLLDQGTAFYTRAQGLGYTTSLADKFIIIDSAGTAITATSPFTWANGDEIVVQGTYLIA
jgi:hypothetical protein